MTRITGVGVVCVCLGFLCGCALVSDKTKAGKKEKEHTIGVLGIPIYHTEKPVEKPGI